MELPEMASMAMAIGVSVPVLRFLLCFVANIPVSFLHQFVPSTTGKHLYAAVMGAVLSYLSFGFSSNLHFLVPMHLGYASMVVARPYYGIITFFIGFGYLIGCHVYYMSGNAWKEGGIDATDNWWLFRVIWKSNRGRLEVLVCILKSGGCPIFLFFLVNTSGQFVGIAEMVGPVDFNKSVEYWQQDKWIGCFPVKWHIVKDVPNNSVNHITLENNENKPVTNSRDIQEVKLEQGLQLLKIFNDNISKSASLMILSSTRITRKKKIRKKKAKQQLYQKQSQV